MNDTLRKIQTFRDYQNGWSFGEGLAFAPERVERALFLLDRLESLGALDTDAFPGLNGEILITVCSGDAYWEFSLEPDDTVIFTYEVNDKEHYSQEGYTLEQAIRQFKETFRVSARPPRLSQQFESFITRPFRLVKGSWRSSAFSTPYTMIKGRRPTHASYSNIPREAGYQSSIKSTFYGTNLPYTFTSRSSIPGEPAAPRQSMEKSR